MNTSGPTSSIKYSVADLAWDLGISEQSITPGVGKTASAVAWYVGSQGAEQAKQFFSVVHQAFPDLQAKIRDESQGRVELTASAKKAEL